MTTLHKGDVVYVLKKEHEAAERVTVRAIRGGRTEDSYYVTGRPRAVRRRDIVTSVEALRAESLKRIARKIADHEERIRHHRASIERLKCWAERWHAANALPIKEVS